MVKNENQETLELTDVGRHLYISSPGAKWKGFGAIAIEEASPQGREDILDPRTERATRCKKYTFNCKYGIDLANLVAIPYLKICWTRLVDTESFLNQKTPIVNSYQPLL